MTKGYNLPAKYVIHTVGPVWKGGNHHEAELLASCYFNSLKLTEKYKLKTIAFPAISIGVYGYPKEEAAKIAIRTVKEYLKKSSLKTAIFVLHSDWDFKLYQAILQNF